MYFPLTTFEGYCVSCDTERPLVVIEHGARGVRAWLAGTGHEDRTLSHTCRVCGRNEHVPLTEAADAEYDLTLRRWPDTFLFAAPTLELEWAAPTAIAADVPAAEVVAEHAVCVDVFALAAERLAVPMPLPVSVRVSLPETAAEAAPVVLQLPAPRKPIVHILRLPVQRVEATDGRILALAVA